jgi:putative cell wall-binding protein
MFHDVVADDKSIMGIQLIGDRLSQSQWMILDKQHVNLFFADMTTHRQRIKEEERMRIERQRQKAEEERIRIEQQRRKEEREKPVSLQDFANSIETVNQIMNQANRNQTSGYYALLKGLGLYGKKTRNSVRKTRKTRKTVKRHSIKST